jgi:hypothetical protein
MCRRCAVRVSAAGRIQGRFVDVTPREFAENVRRYAADARPTGRVRSPPGPRRPPRALLRRAPLTRVCCVWTAPTSRWWSERPAAALRFVWVAWSIWVSAPAPSPRTVRHSDLNRSCAQPLRHPGDGHPDPPGALATDRHRPVEGGRPMGKPRRLSRLEAAYRRLQAHVCDEHGIESAGSASFLEKHHLLAHERRGTRWHQARVPPTACCSAKRSKAGTPPCARPAAGANASPPARPSLAGPRSGSTRPWGPCRLRTRLGDRRLPSSSQLRFRPAPLSVEPRAP